MPITLHPTTTGGDYGYPSNPKSGKEGGPTDAFGLEGLVIIEQLCYPTAAVETSQVLDNNPDACVNRKPR